MTRSTTALVAVIASACALALAPVTAASANSGQPGLATHHTGTIAAPICIGGSGEKRSLRTAARFAQHWNFGGGTPGQFSRSRDVLHQHCADTGRDPAQILLSSQVQFTGDPPETAATAAALGAVGTALAIAYLPPPHTPGVLEPLASALSELS